MKQARITGRFDRDYRQSVKRGKKIEKLDDVMMLLINEEPLPPKLKDHALSGTMSGYRDCHIESDWILIYRVDDDAIVFERTGTHSDIFK